MHKYLIVVVIYFATSTCHGEVRLPKILSSHVVLQQDTNATIWGWADPGEKIEITASWLDDRSSVTANAKGHWQTQLKTKRAGGAHTITVQGQNRIVIDQVMFGEVWLASGQSNMEMPLVKVSGAYTGIKNAEEEVRNADESEIVLFQVGNFSSIEPLEDVNGGIEMYGIPKAACRWQICTPQTVPHFASTAYFFAKTLQRELKVPIGIIDSSWGGTSAEAWTPAEGLQRLGYANDLKLAADRPQKADQKTPTRLYNGMIHPLRKMTIKGVIWYQGEGNTGRADKYQELFTTMITQWRDAWGYEFPFYFAQISPFNYNNVNAAYLREAQLKSMSLVGTGMAVTMDIGNLKDIHPKNKQEVGRRLALWALAKNYGMDVEFSGPFYRESAVEGNTMRVQFNHVGSGLITTDGMPPSHFELAGTDNVFHSATATIEDADIIVSSPDVESPIAVRYAFTSDAEPNLTNSAGLPASSFRSDAR